MQADVDTCTAQLSFKRVTSALLVAAQCVSRSSFLYHLLFSL